MENKTIDENLKEAVKYEPQIKIKFNDDINDTSGFQEKLRGEIKTKIKVYNESVSQIEKYYLSGQWGSSNGYRELVKKQNSLKTLVINYQLLKNKDGEKNSNELMEKIKAAFVFYQNMNQAMAKYLKATNSSVKQGIITRIFPSGRIKNTNKVIEDANAFYKNKSESIPNQNNRQRVLKYSELLDGINEKISASRADQCSLLRNEVEKCKKIFDRRKDPRTLRKLDDRINLYLENQKLWKEGEISQGKEQFKIKNEIQTRNINKLDDSVSESVIQQHRKELAAYFEEEDINKLDESILQFLKEKAKNARNNGFFDQELNIISKDGKQELADTLTRHLSLKRLVNRTNLAAELITNIVESSLQYFGYKED